MKDVNKKASKILVNGICLSVMLLLLSNCGPSRQTRIDELTTDYNKSVQEFNAKVQDFQRRTEENTKVFERWRFSLTNDQVLKLEMLLRLKNNESAETFWGSLSKEQQNQFYKIIEEYQLGMECQQNLDIEFRTLEGKKVYIEYLLEKQRIDRAQFASFINLLAVLSYQGQQQKMMNDIQRINRELQWQKLTK